MIVNTKKFLERMCKKWSKRQQPVSDPLKDAWRILCDNLDEHAEGRNNSKWSVIPLPTGVGKTEGVISYCAELSLAAPKKGVLIITRFTDEADRIVRGINSEAKRIVALTQHSNQNIEDKPSPDKVYKSQVLVITHSAYKKALALEALNKTDALRNKYSAWLHGDRLIVIDEVLRIDEQIIVDYDEARAARYSIPLHIEQKFPQEINRLDYLIDKFFSFISKETAPWYFIVI